MQINKKLPLKLSLLSLSILTCLSPILSIAAPVEEEQAVERIAVTGIRGSLKQSMMEKRAADQVVDTIAPEDLGKFPDQNVAESLQRISGVSIDRSGGEGQFVTVRGFGPEFNTVLVNGRTIATENQGREFSFDTLAAEMISGAEVYKSPTASMQEGGIGATINIKTARPFDLDGFKAVGSVKGFYDDMTEDTTPHISGLISNTFLDDTLGVLVSLSRQERDARIDVIETRGYNPNTQVALPDGRVFDDVFVPQNYDQIVNFEDRKRTSGSVVLQWQPSDRVIFTLDTLYSKFEVDSDATSLGHWFTASEFVDVDVDENNNVVRLVHSNNGATDFINRNFNRDTEINAYGLNTEFTVTDDFIVTLDLAYSEATSDNGGSQAFTVVGFNNGYTFDNSQGSDIPIIAADLAHDPSLGRAHYVERDGFDVEDEITEVKLDAVYTTEFEHLTKIKFGVIASERTKNNQRFFTDPDVNCLYCGYAVDIPDELLSTFDAGNFLGGGNVPTQWLKFDPFAYLNYLASPAAIALNANPDVGATLAANGGYVPQLQPDSFEVEEETLGAYVDFYFEGELGDILWTGNVGFRYIETDQSAFGTQRTLVDLVPIPDDETMFRQIFATDGESIAAEKDYSNFLPSVNLKFNLLDDLILRVGYSETVTRPTMTDLAPRVNIDVTRPENLQASGGNPTLDPFQSTNYDASLEWYYSESSYLALAWFKKDVDDFIISTVGEETFNLVSGDFVFDVRRPRNGETAKVDGLEFAVMHTFETLPTPWDGFGVMLNMTYVDSDAEVDPTQTTETFALEGLGDSQNFVLFYEKESYQFRIAYNNRDGFMQTLSNATGGDPIFVEDYAQWDISASYDIDEHFTVFAEAVNITGEEIRKHGRFSNQFIRAEDSGSRYALGIRAYF